MGLANAVTASVQMMRLSKDANSNNCDMKTKSTFYLIGGAPRTGKTTLAKQLSQKLDLPWISTDTLESVVSEYVPREKFPEMFPKATARVETNRSNDLFYEKYSTPQIIDLYFKQGSTLTKAIKMFLESESIYNHSHILEGFHITPEITSDIQKMGYEAKPIFLGRENLSDTLKSIHQGNMVGDWVIEKTQNEATLEKIADMIVSFSAALKDEAKKYDQQYYSMDGDFQFNLKKTLKHLE